MDDKTKYNFSVFIRTLFVVVFFLTLASTLSPGLPASMLILILLSKLHINKQKKKLKFKEGFNWSNFIAKYFGVGLMSGYVLGVIKNYSFNLILASGISLELLFLGIFYLKERKKVKV